MIKLSGGGKDNMKSDIILAVLFAMLIGTGLAQNATTGDVMAFKQALEQDGFTVQTGSIGYFDIIKLYDLGILPSAYGNNPSTRYLSYFVPPTPGQKVPDLFAKIATALGMRLNSTAFWNLRPDEAIVFVGRTPPECRYFSYDHFLMSRTYGNDTRWIFANIADTVNNLVINTQGTPHGLAGNPFNQTTVIITTADRGIDQRIRAAALSTGYSGDILTPRCFPQTC